MGKDFSKRLTHRKSSLKKGVKTAQKGKE